jgi:cell division topological specificity factor
MSLLNLLFDHKQKSASVAKDRLQLIITHERSDLSNQPDFLPALQYELIDVISKYFSISLNDIKVSLEQQGHYEVLEVNIILPEKAEKLAVKFTGAR